MPIPSRSTDFLTNTLGVNDQQLSLLRRKCNLGLDDYTTEALFHEGGIAKYAGMEYLSYLAALCETKVFISPWGRSAWSRADIEALLCGCIIVKPECSNTETQPDIYSLHKGWVQYCSPDLSDLNSVSHYVLANYLDFAYAAEEGQSFLMDYYTTQATQSAVAEDLFSLCKHILAGTENSFKHITTKIPLGQ